MNRKQDWRTRIALAKKLVTGMRDITPAGMQVRGCMMNQIKGTYKGFGLTQIETSCVEYIGNLTSKQGGDNEKLVFKILKRGDKLNLEGSKEENDLVDNGLRYGLTLPLSRYYANNTANLPGPFKTLQVDSVWRVDRPQRGHFRQLVQYDIDILGGATGLAETELILATTTALRRIRPGNGFTVRTSDRGILRGMALYCGFTKESMDQVFITLDKINKTGYEGVEKELLESGHSPESVSKYLDVLKNVTRDSAGIRALEQMLSEVIPADVSRGLVHIMNTVTEVTEADFDLEFDPTLVRGMSCYAGTTSEVSIEDFDGSVAGGGRYDKMIGKFTDMETPACGFSIGFERIVTILIGDGFTVPSASDRKAPLFEKGVNSIRLAVVTREAVEERKKGVQVLIAQMNKNEKFQREQLDRKEYTKLKEFYKESLRN